MHKSKPLVAIVGRPNVGKSTLFNRLVGSRRAVTADLPGTTRDRVYGDGEWRGREISFVDTGGLTDEVGDTEAPELREAVNEQVSEAIAEADLLLLIVDARTGPTADDRRVTQRLRKAGKAVLLVVNKADNQELGQTASEFWDLGVGDPMSVSALHGRGTGDLLDAILEQADRLPARPPDGESDDTPVVAVVGRPNVGKSTLFNTLARKRVVITSDTPHTTRDVSRIRVETPTGPIRLLDTAGMRRRKISGKGIVKFSLLRTIRAINEADVVCLVVDGTEGPTLGDAHIGSFVVEAGKALVVAVNKWDAVDKASDIQEQFFAQLEERLGFLPSPPVVFISAKTGEKLERLTRAIDDVYKLADTRIETSELNSFLGKELGRVTRTAPRGTPRLYYATQVASRPPTIRLFVNKPELWADNQRRFLVNTLREHYGLLGSTVRLQFRARRKERVS